MPDFIRPEGKEELSFHEHMLKDRPSVQGIRILSECDPAAWKDRWQSPSEEDCWYRLVYCDACGYFVGDVAWKKQNDTDGLLWLMIQGDLRSSGYGSAVLKHTAKAAKGTLKTFTVILPPDHPDLSFFTNRGFTLIEETPEQITLRAKTDTLAGVRCSECCSAGK